MSLEPENWTFEELRLQEELTNEDNGRRQLVGDAEELAHELGTVAQVLLDELGADDAQKGGTRLIRHRLRQQRLARTGFTVQDDALQQKSFRVSL